VTLLDLDLELEITYELVIPELANLEQGLVSVASPIGRGLLGRKLGDKAVIPIPSGKKRFEVLVLRTIHDKETEEPAS
jgi:transcription elongation factor GreA